MSTNSNEFGGNFHKNPHAKKATQINRVPEEHFQTKNLKNLNNQNNNYNETSQ